jgi:DNA-binding IclR family transcriptional regulator
VVQTVARALGVLRLLAEGPASLTEVTEAIGVHKSTALRLLQTLETENFVRRGTNGRYVVGFGVIPLAESAMDQIDLRAAAHQPLRRLAAEIGHTVHLAQYLDGQIIYVDKVNGRGTVAMGSRVGQPADLHTAAVAKIIVSHLLESERARLLEDATFERYGPTTIDNLEDYLTELRRTRRRGWAEDNGEKEDYINCVALPIRDAVGRVRMGLSVTALRAVAPLETLREFVPLIRLVTEEISEHLGWRRDLLIEHPRAEKVTGP